MDRSTIAIVLLPWFVAIGIWLAGAGHPFWAGFMLGETVRIVVKVIGVLRAET